MRCRGLDGAWGRWHLSDYGGRWVCVEVLGGDVGALVNFVRFSRLILLFWVLCFVYYIACFSLNFRLCTGNG